MNDRREKLRLRSLTSTLTKCTPGSDAVPAQGELASVDVIALLRTFNARKSTGVLTFECTNVHYNLYFHHGDVIAASTDVEDLRLGVFLYRVNQLTLEQLEEAVQASTAEKQLGEVLVEKGFVTARMRQEGLTAQFREILNAVFLLQEARYSFSPQETIFAENLQLFLDTETLLEDGERLVEKVSRLARNLEREDRIYRVKSDHPVPHRKEQEELLRYFDGHRPTSELFALSPFDQVNTLHIIWHLLDQGIIEQVAGKQTPDKSPEGPISSSLQSADEPTTDAFPGIGRRTGLPPDRTEDASSQDAGVFFSAHSVLDRVDLSHVQQYGVAAEIPLDGVVETISADDYEAHMLGTEAGDSAHLVVAANDEDDEDEADSVMLEDEDDDDSVSIVGEDEKGALEDYLAASEDEQEPLMLGDEEDEDDPEASSPEDAGETSTAPAGDGVYHGGRQGQSLQLADLAETASSPEGYPRGTLLGTLEDTADDSIDRSVAEFEADPEQIEDDLDIEALDTEEIFLGQTGEYVMYGDVESFGPDVDDQQGAPGAGRSGRAGYDLSVIPEVQVAGQVHGDEDDLELEELSPDAVSLVSTDDEPIELDQPVYPDQPLFTEPPILSDEAQHITSHPHGGNALQLDADRNEDEGTDIALLDPQMPIGGSARHHSAATDIEFSKEEQAVLDSIIGIFPQPPHESSGARSTSIALPAIGQVQPPESPLNRAQRALLGERGEIYNRIFSQIFAHFAHKLGTDRTTQIFESFFTPGNSSHPEIYTRVSFGSIGAIDVDAMLENLAAQVHHRPAEVFDACLNEIFYFLLRDIHLILDDDEQDLLMRSIVPLRNLLFKRLARRQ